MLLTSNDAMTDQERLSKIEEAVSAARLWQAKHDGQNTAFWNAQHALNREHDADHKIDEARYGRKFGELDKRLTSVEKKIVWLCSLAAAGGGAVGPLLKMLTG